MPAVNLQSPIGRWDYGICCYIYSYLWRHRGGHTTIFQYEIEIPGTFPLLFAFPVQILVFIFCDGRICRFL